MTLSYRDRLDHWHWCREYIDRECVYRVGWNEDKTYRPMIPGKAPGSTYTWQFYLRRATFNAEFARRLGFLFWDRFEPVFRQQPFQLGACQPSGPPIATAIQHTAPGFNVNALLVRRTPKNFGTDNWFDGQALRGIPVLMVDDIAASAPFLLLGAARVRHKLGLPLHFNYFTIVNKVGRGFHKVNQHTENYLDNELVSLFTMNNFAHDVERFAERYGHPPKWSGLVA